MLSLFAPHSLFDTVHQSEGGSHWGDPHSDTAEADEESAVRGESSANTLITRVFSAAKIGGLQPPMSDPVPVGGVREDIYQTSPPPCIPVADDYASLQNHLKSLISMHAVDGWLMPVTQWKLD